MNAPPQTMGRQGESFRDFVGRDIRGLTSEAEATLLRSPAIAERWLTTLLMMQRSVEGQLAAGQEDFLSRQARLRRERRQLADADSIRQLDDALDRLQEDHSSDRAKKLRFKCGLDETLIEARSIVGRP